MIKVFQPSGWSWDRPVAQQIKMSSRGLIGSDRSDFIKLAGATAHVFLDKLDKIKIAADELPVHMLAMGATEAFGNNRNADGFKEGMLKRCHDTFVTHARPYRNHANRDPSQSYGKIKASAYNDAMRRVELLIGYNMNKEAAKRNGGLVADKEIEKLAKGEDIPGSMAIRVPHDICSSCQHKARTRDEYCTEDTCIGPHGEKRGGCRHNLGKVGADGHVLHVDNPDGTFFDLSHVFRPADRTAYGTKADWLQKAAGDAFVGGAEMAEALGIEAPLEVCLRQDEPWAFSAAVRGQVKLAAALAIHEANNTQLNAAFQKSLHPLLQPALSDAQLSVLGAPGTVKSAEAISAMADRKVLLTLTDFARWTGREHLTKAASDILPGVFRRLAASPEELTAKVTQNKYACTDKAASLAVKTLAASLMDSHSLATDAVRDRAMKCELRRLPEPSVKSAFNEKAASDSSEAATLADEYGLYKLAALHRIASFDQQFHLTASLAIAQNRV